jgi:DUF1009 family protein
MMEEGTKLGIGLIAGSGLLPEVGARFATESGYDLTVIDLTQQGQRFRDYTNQIYELSPMQWGKVIEVLHTHRVSNIYFLGEVKKEVLFISGGIPDERLASLLASLPTLSDSQILYGLTADLEQEGFTVGAQTELVGALVCEPGQWVREPTVREERDIEIALRAAGVLTDLDIGQTVIAKDTAVVAVEAMEQTDATINRAAALTGGGGVLVKMKRKNQDQRFDIPCIGPQTLATMAAAKLTALVFASGTLLLEREKILGTAEKANIAIVCIP